MGTRTKREEARLSSRRKFSVAVPVFSFIAAGAALGWAILSFYVNSFKYVLLLSYVGLVYFVLASLWCVAGWGILKDQRWGRFFGFIASLAAILNGVYRLSQTPTLGLLALYDLGLWITTVNGILLAGLVLFSAVPKEKGQKL